MERQVRDTLCMPGLSFLDAVFWQLELVESIDLWNVAVHVLHHIATTPPRSWRTFLAAGLCAEHQIQRAAQFRKHGVTKVLQGARVASQNYDVLVYVLDRCCGICDRDWTPSRLCQNAAGGGN